MELKDKVAIVTGASSGVGKAIASNFAANGCNLVLAARREEILEELSTKLNREYGVRALAVKTDLTLYTEVARLFKTTQEEFGRLDYLVNVAGDFPKISFVDSSVEDFFVTYEKIRRLMQDAVIYASKFALEMILKNQGVIINITSDAGLEKNVYPDQLPYLMAKAAINHASRGMDLEVRKKGARVFAIAPGNIDTPLLRRAIESDPNLVSVIEEKTGSLNNFYEKILKPKDVADKVLDMVKNPGRYENSVVEMPSFEF